MVSVSVTAVQEEMEVIRFHASNQVERVQVHLTYLLNAANRRILDLYGETVTWINGLNIQHRVGSSWNLIVSKGENLANIFRNLGVHVHLSPYITNVKAFFTNEVSKQALYFGCAGLVTGGVIGLCIGYTVRQSSLSSQYFSSPANGTPTLMKAILCSSSRRGTDITRVDTLHKNIMSDINTRQVLREGFVQGITLATLAVPRCLGSNEVLIQIKALGLDNIDVRIACGYGHLLRSHLSMPSVNEPFVLGRECSGVVLEIGSQVMSFDINDRVWVCLPLWASVGVMSEYAVVLENYIGHKPRNIGFEGAATLPYAALVVWRHIIPKSHLGPHSAKNKRVLVHLGPTSKNDGVGLLATQVLKSWGARVTISTAETGYTVDDEEVNSSGVAQMTFLRTLKSLGAESHIILPNDTELLPDLAQRIFDVVVNTDSPTVTPLLENFVKNPNDEVIETFPSDLSRRFTWNLFHYILDSTINLFFRAKEEEETCQCILDECRRLVESGFVVPVVSRSFLASQYDQAFRHVSNSSNSALAHVGKSVLVFKALPSPS